MTERIIGRRPSSESNRHRYPCACGFLSLPPGYLACLSPGAALIVPYDIFEPRAHRVCTAPEKISKGDEVVAPLDLQSAKPHQWCAERRPPGGTEGARVTSLPHSLHGSSVDAALRIAECKALRPGTILDLVLRPDQFVSTLFLGGIGQQPVVSRVRSADNAIGLHELEDLRPRQHGKTIFEDLKRAAHESGRHEHRKRYVEACEYRERNAEDTLERIIEGHQKSILRPDGPIMLRRSEGAKVNGCVPFGHFIHLPFEIRARDAQGGGSDPDRVVAEHPYGNPGVRSRYLRCSHRLERQTLRNSVH